MEPGVTSLLLDEVKVVKLFSNALLRLLIFSIVIPGLSFTPIKSLVPTVPSISPPTIETSANGTGVVVPVVTTVIFRSMYISFAELVAVRNGRSVSMLPVSSSISSIVAFTNPVISTRASRPVETLLNR